MDTCPDLECAVCAHEFNADERIPRVLECQHTFCTLCLHKLAERKPQHLAILCPLCRRVTCVSARLTLTCSLLVDIEVWSQVIVAWRHKKEPVDPAELPREDAEWKSVGTNSPENKSDKRKRQLKKLLLFLRGY